MAAVGNYCKGKTVCATDDPKEEGDNSEEKRGHGGCGHIQPQIRKEGLKLFLQYKKVEGEDEVCPLTNLTPTGCSKARQ